MGNHCDKILDLHPDYVREIKVDPINGLAHIFHTFSTNFTLELSDTGQVQFALFVSKYSVRK